MVIDPRGNQLGIVTLQLGITPMAISATHMWGMELAGGAVNLVRYRVNASR
jgi:hypothetical protein